MDVPLILMFYRREYLTIILLLFFFVVWRGLSVAQMELPKFPFRSMTPVLPPIVFPSHEEKTRALREAARFGLDEALNLFENVEPQLYTRGIYLDDDDPARYLAAINNLEPRGKLLSRAAFASLQATQKLKDKLFLSKQQIIFSLINVNVSDSALALKCPSKRSSSECDKLTLRYRTTDGRCNNPKHPTWGQSQRPFLRRLPPDYDDGISTIRRSITGQLLPSPRRVSSSIHRDKNRPNSNISLLLMQWGQFLDHDLTFTPMGRGFNNSAIKCCYVPEDLLHPECLPIHIPNDDSFYSVHNQSCMEFVRSSPVPFEDCSLGPRNQINQVTSYLDGSTVYGSNDEQASTLREHRHGRLAVQRLGLRQPLLPHSPESKLEECRDFANKFCFRAGDKRVNEQPGLASLHTLWMREHNRVARELSSINPHWNDELLFQESRRIIIAQMQRITYNEFLPVILGPTVIKLFDLQLKKNSFFWDYDPTLDGTMINVFGSAVFRFGHSLVPESMQRCDKNFNIFPSNIALADEMMRPRVLHNFGAIDRLILGMANQESQQRDEFVSDQLTNHLFQSKVHHYGMDLIALNIQRGRDHGLPSYVYWREYCGLRKPKDFSELQGLVATDTVERLRDLYERVEDIDLFPGGMAEKPVVGGMVGPTFACLIGQVFQTLRNADRFWYENGGFVSSFTKAQLDALQKSTFARVLCDNLDDIDTIQLWVMKANVKGSNPRVACRGPRIPALNLTAWKEILVENRGQINKKPRPSLFPHWLHQFKWNKRTATVQ